MGLTHKNFMSYTNYWDVTVCQSIRQPASVSNKTGVNPRGSEVDHDVCGEKNVDEQIHHEKTPVVETRNVSLLAVRPPIDGRIRSVEIAHS